MKNTVNNETQASDNKILVERSYKIVLGLFSFKIDQFYCSDYILYI